jgi:hypothetical protein
MRTVNTLNPDRRFNAACTAHPVSPSAPLKIKCRFQNSFSHDPRPLHRPLPQAIAERDAIKTQLTSARDELTAAKGQSATLDVSILQLTASTERLKV